MEVEAAGSSVDGGVLGNVGVVDHTVLSVLHKGMDFRVAVGGKPLMQECFAMGCPQNGTVENAAVLEGVGQTGKIDAASVAEGICRQLYFLIPLNEDFRASSA